MDPINRILKKGFYYTKETDDFDSHIREVNNYIEKTTGIIVENSLQFPDFIVDIKELQDLFDKLSENYEINANCTFEHLSRRFVDRGEGPKYSTDRCNLYTSRDKNKISDRIDSKHCKGFYGDSRITRLEIQIIDRYKNQNINVSYSYTKLDPFAKLLAYRINYLESKKLD